ncbi:histidine--tRNA ligase [bacterium]|nr:histidine--tRNA ligase [bacterium]
MKYKAPRGTQDVLPGDSWKWQRIETVFRETAARFGYEEIRTPVFEKTELFARGIGDATDIVRKEMYTFEDRKGRSLTLRPEGTASVVRAFVEHGMGRGARVTKLRYFCPMFRYERPQAGRYRQFWQWGLEALGSSSPAIDAEIIHFSVSFFAGLGIRDTGARINSAGCPACTPTYNELLREELAPKLNEFCDDCRERYERNPRRMFDCKNARCQELLSDAPSILDALCDECREHFNAVRAHLDTIGVPYVLDSKMARGLDYYTKTIFEVHYDKLGAQNALCGGGRYDGLVEELGGVPTPACGVSSGVERLVMALEEEDAFGENAPVPDIYIVAGEGDTAASNVELAARLRERFSVEMDYQGRSLNKQMQEAGKLGARFVVVNNGRDAPLRVRESGAGWETETTPDTVAEAIAKRMAEAD